MPKIIKILKVKYQNQIIPLKRNFLFPLKGFYRKKPRIYYTHSHYTSRTIVIELTDLAPGRYLNWPSIFNYLSMKK